MPNPQTAEEIAALISSKNYELVTVSADGNNVIVLVTGPVARVWDIAKAIEALLANTVYTAGEILINGQLLSDTVNRYE